MPEVYTNSGWGGHLNTTTAGKCKTKVIADLIQIKALVLQKHFNFSGIAIIIFARSKKAYEQKQEWKKRTLHRHHFYWNILCSLRCASTTHPLSVTGHEWDLQGNNHEITVNTKKIFIRISAEININLWEDLLIVFSLSHISYPNILTLVLILTLYVSAGERSMTIVAFIFTCIFCALVYFVQLLFHLG